MRPTTAHDNVFDFEALLHPGTVFDWLADRESSCFTHPQTGTSANGISPRNLMSGETRAIMGALGSVLTSAPVCIWLASK
jgi:hypothetical protein